MNGADEGLTQLFRDYRDACPDPDASAEFMPRLWERIEARRAFTWKVVRLSKGLATIAAVICLMITVVSLRSTSGPSPVVTTTYLETLEEAGSLENLAYAVDVSSDPFRSWEDSESRGPAQ